MTVNSGIFAAGRNKVGGAQASEDGLASLLSFFFFLSLFFFLSSFPTFIHAIIGLA